MSLSRLLSFPFRSPLPFVRPFSSSSYPHNVHSPYLAAAVSQASDVIVDHAQGSWIFGKNGRKYVDFSCGIGVINLGHSHPKVNEAAIKQIHKGVHLQVACVSHQPMIDLASKFGPYLPPSLRDDYQAFFANSGSEAVENAIKISRHATKRQTVIVFQGGFHGRTIGTGALTTAKAVYRAGYQPTMGGVHVVPFPYCSRCPVAAVKEGPGCTPSVCCNEAIVQLRNCLKQQTSPDEVAAILIEPVLGEGGYVVPPAGFLQAVQSIANEIGALMVADEVQTGFGRTGSMFAAETFSFNPDIMVLAKGIANGFPLSGVLVHGKYMSKARMGSLGGTFGGNVVACAAANAVLDVFKEEKVLDNVKQRGEQLRSRLKKFQQKYPHVIRDVRGVGLMNAIEFQDNVKGVGDHLSWASLVQKQCVANGMIVLTAGIHESLRLIPPLNITEEDMDIGLGILDKSVKSVFKL